MKALVVLGLLAALCLLHGATMAEEGFQGRNELQFSAAWMDVEDVSVTFLAGKYARQVTPILDLGLELMFIDGSVDADFEDDDASLWAIAPSVALNFPSKIDSRTVPYVGAGFYHVDGDGDSESGFQAFAGAKFFIGGDYRTASHAFFVEYRHINGLFDANLNSIAVGITNFF